VNLLIDELFCRRSRIDCVLGLLIDVLAGEFRSHGLSSVCISAAVSNVKAVGDVVAAGVYLDLDAGAHVLNQRFHRLAALSFRLVKIIFLDQWFERTTAGNDLRDAVYLTRKAIFCNRGDNGIW